MATEVCGSACLAPDWNISTVRHHVQRKRRLFTEQSRRLWMDFYDFDWYRCLQRQEVNTKGLLSDFNTTSTSFDKMKNKTKKLGKSRLYWFVAIGSPSIAWPLWNTHLSCNRVGLSVCAVTLLRIWKPSTWWDFVLSLKQISVYLINCSSFFQHPETPLLWQLNSS